MRFSIDFELTNRCNASCHFCPRDRTPHQGLMSMETFEQGLRRAIEYRSQVEAAIAPQPVEVDISLCGLGEPLLNKHAADFARAVRGAGFSCSFSSNGALLDERRATALLDAGVQIAYLNIGDIGDRYEEVYQLPFERTRDNIVRFTQLAEGRCETCIVLVNYRRDPDHVEDMKRYWSEYGITVFQDYEIMNRGGSLFVDHMQYETLAARGEAEQLLRAGGQTPLCGAPFAYLFVGYDANYYLCCSDWEKRAPVGTVFDNSFLDVTGAKLRHVMDRQVVCQTCNLDPINRLTEVLHHSDRGVEDPEVIELVESLRAGTVAIADALTQVDPSSAAILRADPPQRRNLIPVVAES
jgi:MoaA/NifB/PqqE/SkfB family radical SAM enzyme